jgi:hypothetical protein
LRQFIQLNWGYGGSISGPDDNISFSLGIIPLVLAFLGSVAIMVWQRRKKGELYILFASWVIILISVLMSTFKMRRLWEIVPLMKYVQFPWRYLSVIIVFLSMIAGSIALLWQRLPLKLGYSITGLAIIVTILIQGKVFRPEAYLEDNNLLYYSDAVKIQNHMSGIIPDFLPIDANLKLTTPPFSRFLITPPPHRIEALIDRTSEFFVTASINQASIFKANIYYFPGWTIYLDGKQVQPQVDPTNGTIDIPLPKTGDVVISGKFQETPLRTVADTISVVSLLICGYLLLPKTEKYYGNTYA